MEGMQVEEVKYKKYVYALRPLLACRYIKDYHEVPPVMFDDLLKQNLPKDLSLEIGKMFEIKTKSDEIDLNPKMPVIQKFIEDEIVRYEQVVKDMPDDRNSDWETLEHVFLKILMRNVGEEILRNSFLRKSIKLAYFGTYVYDNKICISTKKFISTTSMWRICKICTIII